MIFKNTPTITFDEAYNRVMDITKTAKTELICADNQLTIPEIKHFSIYGLQAFGKTVGFPAPFVSKVAETNPDLANVIVRDRTRNFFGGDEPNDRTFYTRTFKDKICGVVSNKYAYFDDNQVMEILEGSPLAEMNLQNAIITPERLHLRAIDVDNPFTIGNDGSELFFAYFIDNSMVGQSSFRVQIGIFRLACSNGLIVPMKEFVMCRQVHIGKKDIAAEFNANIAFLTEKQDTIKDMLCGLSNETATIETLQAEFKEDYLAKKLNLNKKETEKVLELYNNVYDGHTKWGMTNAITEFARDVKDINRREYLERLAIKVA